MAGTTAMLPTRIHQQSGDDRGLLITSDVNVMMKQIMATHTPDGREFDVKPLLHVIKDVMHHANPSKPGIDLATTQAQVQALDEMALQSGFSDMLELLAYPINRIACEISCKCLGGSDAHAITVGLFNMLSSYMWDAKVVIALAAFAVNYGQFWLVTKLSPTNLLADSVAFLKQLPVIQESLDILVLTDPLEALTNLIKAMLAMTNCIIEFKELPSLYITPETPALVNATAHIPLAVYWTIRSIMACASQIMSLIDMGHEYIESTTEAWELSSLADMVSNMHSHLKGQLVLCYQHIDEKRDAEAYQTLVRIVGMSHIDNMKMLKCLINDKKDQLPLWDGHSKRQVSLDVLRRKNVLLFISEPDLSYDKGHLILHWMYNASREHPSRLESQYEIVWLPVVDRSTPRINAMQFESSKASMPWYSVYDPSLLYPSVIKYFKEVWHFNKKPLLVALDPLGNVVNTNAIHMMWIWGNLAFPFTTATEDGLWREATSLIELLADSIEPLISTWISEEKYICLYGGEDIEWIRKFTKTAKAVAQAARIPLEMLYVGKSYLRMKVLENNTTIVAENLSHIVPDLDRIWLFWVRLENMWHSKTKHGKSIENNTIVQEIMAMLSFDRSDQGWAVISRGSAEMAKANGDTILKSLTQFEQWKEQAGQAGFVAALNQNLHDLHTPHHCSHLILPEATCGIPERVACAECGRQMEKFIMYRCCGTHEAETEFLYTSIHMLGHVHQDFRPRRRITARKGGLRRNFQKFIMARCYTD